MKYLFIALILVAVVFLFAQQNGLRRLIASQFKEAIENNRSENIEFVLLDIRTLPEFEAGHIEGAQMLDFYSKNFVQDLNKMDKELTYLIYCRSGNRTGQTLGLMQKLGFKKAFDLKNGINSWIQAGYKVTK